MSDDGTKTMTVFAKDVDKNGMVGVTDGIVKVLSVNKGATRWADRKSDDKPAELFDSTGIIASFTGSFKYHDMTKDNLFDGLYIRFEKGDEDAYVTVRYFETDEVTKWLHDSGLMYWNITEDDEGEKVAA